MLLKVISIMKQVAVHDNQWRGYMFTSECEVSFISGNEGKKVKRVWLHQTLVLCDLEC